ncbi:MAG TPA: prepilin peptidase [Candidatus Hydrogenedentes bacterium]|nr:prepilin peptidase [Candidatus Hydrogenedentota bacterium]HPG66666.1 prepilin peptidase [Candidatus Hydrogenedentota bacterium]
MTEPIDLSPLYTFFSLVSFVLGCMVGSFLNVCVYRLPRGESIVKPRSHCPKCDSLIVWHDNVPILSWVLLGAKCRHCGQSISWMYPLVESITGLLFLFVFWRFGFTAATPIYMGFVASMVLVTFVDLTDWTIPNEVTFPGIPLGILLALVGMLYPPSGLVVNDVFDSLIGAVVGGGSLYLLDKISLVILRKRGMGFGDVKLLAMLGAFLGWRGVILIIMISSCLGSVVGITMIALDRWRVKQKGESASEEEAEGLSPGHYLPFGPYLAAAGLIVLFFGKAILAAYYSYVTGGAVGGVIL